VVAFRDMTEALKMQEERVRTERIASLGLLAGGIAHDFNNILMAITGHVSLARATVSSINPASSSLAEAEQACVRARQLTWQLLSFSKGGVPVKRETAIGPMLKESASLALRGTNVDCKWQLAPELWSVRADESQIVQVFNNVLINARQAISSEGTIEIRAENVFEPSQRWEHALSVEPGPYVRVSISDTGVGIPHDHLSRIFDPFFSTKESGCGLGLASSYSIIKNHGGFVSVESKVECGTTITVNLPASVNREIAAEAETIRTLSRGKRVLVMDDEASIRSLAVSMLKHLGHDAEVVSDGSAAVERYRSALKHGVPYAAVILDLMVPGGMGARETMELLTEMDPSVNAIVVSGYARDSVMLEFKDHGFKAMIGKPFTLDELSKTLKSIIPTERIWTVH
jgi:nitrogen-specific signal transduction histidine kinase